MDGFCLFFFFYFSTSLHYVKSTISILWPWKSQKAWTCSIFMHCLLTDCSVKTDHWNIPFWLYIMIIHFTELGAASGMAASGSSKSGAAHACQAQRIPRCRQGAVPQHPGRAGGGDSSRQPQMSQVQGVQTGGTGDGARDKVTYNRRGASWDSSWPQHSHSTSLRAYGGLQHRSH